MKITKEKVRQIINEELEALANETISEQPEEPETGKISSTSQFAQRLVDISKKIRGGELKGLDVQEMSEILEILIDVIREAEQESSGTLMTQISAIIDRKVGL